MLGELTPSEIEVLLHSQFVGRIGCTDFINVFVVPVAYAYDGVFIYGHSKEGVKVKMMRANPSVCFEADKVIGIKNWESVILSGIYEELTNPEEQHAAMRIFNNRMGPYMSNEINVPITRQPEPHPVGATYKPIVFRIKILTKSGRFERV